MTCVYLCKYPQHCALCLRVWAMRTPSTQPTASTLLYIPPNITSLNIPPTTTSTSLHIYPSLCSSPTKIRNHHHQVATHPSIPHLADPTLITTEQPAPLAQPATPADLPCSYLPPLPLPTPLVLNGHAGPTAAARRAIKGQGQGRSNIEDDAQGGGDC